MDLEKVDRTARAIAFCGFCSLSDSERAVLDREKKFHDAVMSRVAELSREALIARSPHCRHEADCPVFLNVGGMLDDHVPQGDKRRAHPCFFVNGKLGDCFRKESPYFRQRVTGA